MEGIISILGSESDCERTKATASLRRTLSADMSSKKWQAQHGFIPLKRVASSEQLFSSSSFSSSSSSCSDSDHDKKELGQFDIWSSIVAQKAKEEELVSAPYVHPLVKRSASSLSRKSLEICTESLGSETGSDVYSSCPSSETNSDREEEDDDKEEDVRVEESKVERSEMEPGVAKYKRVQPRAFPPPIPSLGSCEGSRVLMKSHRNNGRVVLEAVSVPSQNNFRAERHDGRLVLSFEGGKMAAEEEETEQFEFEMGGRAAEDKQGEGVEDDKKVRFMKELDTSRLPNVVIMHKLALMMKKSRVLANDMNSNWINKFDDLAEAEKRVEEMDVERPSPLTLSLPPRPPMARRTMATTKATIVEASTKVTGSLNAYEYYWKVKSTAPMRVASKLSGLSQAAKKPPSLHESDNHKNNLVVSKNYVANERQQMMLLRGNKGDYLVPMLKGCKDPRRSFSLKEPHCIATS